MLRWRPLGWVSIWVAVMARSPVGWAGMGAGHAIAPKPSPVVNGSRAP
jgi:hypothetical protein